MIAHVHKMIRKNTNARRPYSWVAFAALWGLFCGLLHSSTYSTKTLQRLSTENFIHFTDFRRYYYCTDYLDVPNDPSNTLAWKVLPSSVCSCTGQVAKSPEEVIKVANSRQFQSPSKSPIRTLQFLVANFKFIRRVKVPSRGYRKTQMRCVCASASKRTHISHSHPLI